MNGMLSRIRLTYYYPVLFVIFFIVVFESHKIQMSGGPLTLFSVNSFLLAFYLGPIMSGQKQRIDDLARTIRGEAISVLNIVTHSYSFDPAIRAELLKHVRQYIAACAHSHKPDEGERDYERLLEFCLNVSGKDKQQMDKVIDTLVSNQQNRGQLSTLLRAGVYSHEWVVLLVLFTITISYIALIDYGGSVILSVVAALLCAGLTLLLLILQKLNSLTHKRAKQIWEPFDRLLATNLRQID